MTRALLLCLLALSLCIAAPVRAEDYVIGVNSAYSRVPVKHKVEELFDAIYAPLGIRPKLAFLPSKRGLFMADSGRLDAEAGRALDIAQDYQNLVIVPEAMIHHELLYFCIDREDCQKSTSLRYALIRGFEEGKNFCRENAFDCLYDQSPAFLSKAFVNRAVQTLIGSKVTASLLFCESGFKTVFYRSIPELEVVSFHLVHKKHQDKLAELALSIKQLKKDGYFQKFVEATSKRPHQCETAFVDLG